MLVKTVAVPKVCSHKKLLEILASEEVLSGQWDRLKLFLPNNCFLYSSAIAFLCSWGIYLHGKTKVFSFKGNPEACQYLSRMNLFRYLEVPYHEHFERHTPTGRFLPLQLVEDDDSAFQATDAICDLVLHRFDNARSFLPAMEWAVSEIIDNIITHAQSPVPGAVCAQYYPQKDRLDIGIFDMGRGIKESLSEAIPLSSHEEAIRRAMEKGTTRNSRFGQGNGLAGTRIIAELNGAEFHLWTGDQNYALTDPREEHFCDIPMFRGTGLLLRMNTDRPVDLENTFIAADSWNYLLAEEQRIQEQGGLKIKDECRHTRSRKVARPLRRKILNLLPDSEGRFVLDFSGVSNTSSSYLDELLGKMADTLGLEKFTQTIQLANIDPTLLKMANVVVHQRVGGEPQLTQPPHVMPSDDQVIVHLIATGLVLLVQHTESGNLPTVPYPSPLQRGLNLLTLACMQREQSPPQGIPDLLDWCHRPLTYWPLNLPPEAVGQTDQLLRNSWPTEVCEEWAYARPSVEAELDEQSIMKAVMTQCRNMSSPEAYREFRKLLIEQPVLTAFEFQKLEVKSLLRPLREHLQAAYQPVSHARLVDGYFYCCPTCGSLLNRTMDGQLVCDNRYCPPITDLPEQKIAESEGVLYLKRGLRRSVTIPGRYEIRLAKALEKILGKGNVILWPEFDQYDLRLIFSTGQVWAVDVKDWSNPFLLAKDVNAHPFPNQPSWTEAFFVFPRERRKQRPDYVRAFKASLSTANSHIAALFDSDFIRRVRSEQEKTVSA